MPLQPFRSRPPEFADPSYEIRENYDDRLEENITLAWEEAEAAREAASDAERPLTAGSNITIDRSNPEAPVISATGGGGGGSTAWDDITGKPTTFAPTIGSGATQAVAGNDSRLADARTPTAHTHDDRYYTESEVDSSLAGKLSRTNTHTAGALATPDLIVNVRAAVDPADANIAEYKVNGVNKAWQNEWGAFRGTSPYAWGDALFRAIRDNGDGITSGYAYELVDRRTGASNRIMFGISWVDGKMRQGGADVGTVFTLTAAQTTGDIPANLPPGTLIVKRTS